MNSRTSGLYPYCLLMGFWLIITAVPCYGAPQMTGVVWDQPFEEILDVQEGKIDKQALLKHDTKTSAISIPYTRVDVVIRNGIAFTRLLQIYHNHSEKNEGYAFGQATTPDTQITQFNIWDRGERYLGAIEERTKAEDAYKSITGDEAPTMEVDPGLVRKTFNRFEMRVFPIYPGENKQIELVTHERLLLDGDGLRLTLPLQSLLKSSDTRHPLVSSAKTELNIRIADDLPIGSVSFNGASPKELKRSTHHSSYTVTLGPNKISDLTIAYKLKIPAEPSVAQLTFADKGEQFFALRIFNPIDQEKLKRELNEAKKKGTDEMQLKGAFGGHTGSSSKTEPTIPKPDTPPLYIAVWRSPDGHSANPDMINLDLELAGYQTFMLFDKKKFFHASWLTTQEMGRARGTASYMKVTTDKAYPNPYWMLPLGKGMEKSRAVEQASLETERNSKQASPVAKKSYDAHFSEVLDHLEHAIQKDKCPLIYLFLEDLGVDRFGRLEKEISQAPQATFLLISKENIVPNSIAKLANVSLFSFDRGWLKNKHFHSSQQLLVGNESQAMFASFGLPLSVSELHSLWNRLPDIDPQVPKWKSSGEIQFSDVSYLNGSYPEPPGARNGVSDQTETASFNLLWLVGRYAGSGKSTLSLQYPQFAMPFVSMGMFSQTLAVPLHTLETTVDLAKPDSKLRFVGSFVGSVQAAELDAKIRMRSRRQENQSDKAKTPREEAELAKLRREIVELSRRFSFISNETAFIAVPEKLRQEHGIEAQRFEMGQLYGSADAEDITVVPEPSTWVLLLSALAALAFFRKRLASREFGLAQSNMAC